MLFHTKSRFKKNQIVMLIDKSTKSDTYMGWSFTTSSFFANYQIFQNACQEIFIHVITVILLVPCTYLHHQLSYLMSFASSKTLHSVSFWTKFWKKRLETSQVKYHQIQILQILTHQVLYLILKNPWIFLLAIWYMEKGIEKRDVEIKVLLF